jgi:hypothetical protein
MRSQLLRKKKELLPLLSIFPSRSLIPLPAPAASMAFARREHEPPRPALLFLLSILPLLVLFTFSSAAAPPSAASPAALHNNNWAVLVCTSRFW